MEKGYDVIFCLKQNETDWIKEFSNKYDISPNLVLFILLVEDKRFLRHRGVDWIGLIRAIIHNIVKVNTQMNKYGIISSDSLYYQALLNFYRGYLRRNFEITYPITDVLYTDKDSKIFYIHLTDVSNSI